MSTSRRTGSFLKGRLSWTCGGEPSQGKDPSNTTVSKSLQDPAINTQGYRKLVAEMNKQTFHTPQVKLSWLEFRMVYLKSARGMSGTRYWWSAAQDERPDGWKSAVLSSFLLLLLFLEIPSSPIFVFVVYSFNIVYLSLCLHGTYLYVFELVQQRIIESTIHMESIGCWANNVWFFCLSFTLARFEMTKQQFSAWEVIGPMTWLYHLLAGYT